MASASPRTVYPSRRSRTPRGRTREQCDLHGAVSRAATGDASTVCRADLVTASSGSEPVRSRAPDAPARGSRRGALPPRSPAEESRSRPRCPSRAHPEDYRQEPQRRKARSGDRQRYRQKDEVVQPDDGRERECRSDRRDEAALVVADPPAVVRGHARRATTDDDRRQPGRRSFRSRTPTITAKIE